MRRDRPITALTCCRCGAYRRPASFAKRSEDLAEAFVQRGIGEAEAGAAQPDVREHGVSPEVVRQDRTDHQSSRHPRHRSRLLVLPVIAIQAAGWLAVIMWPGTAPLWLLFVLAFAMSTGGPGSMIGFDHARTFNPSHRLSTATGITNVGGFLAALLAILLIGIAMDAQGAGTPETYTLDAFRLAFLTQVPLWFIGSLFIVIERKRTRVHIGLDEPRSRPRDRGTSGLG